MRFPLLFAVLATPAVAAEGDPSFHIELSGAPGLDQAVTSDR